jgi:hypothetical protein
LNREYDFALSVAELGPAPALAARLRREGNVDLSRRLARVEPIAERALLDRLLHYCARECRASGARVYGVLFGQSLPRLRVVLETTDGLGASRQYWLVGPTDHHDALARRGALQRAFDSGLAGLLRSDVAGQSRTPGALPARCSVGGNEWATGELLSEHDGYRVLVLAGEETLPTYAACPLARTSLSTPADQPLTSPDPP